MKTKDWIDLICTQILMFVFVIGYFIIMTMMINAQRWSTVDNMLGATLTIVVMIAAYKWGSSASAAKHSETLADQQKILAEKINPATPENSEIKSTKVETTETTSDSQGQ